MAIIEGSGTGGGGKTSVKKPKLTSGVNTSRSGGLSTVNEKTADAYNAAAQKQNAARQAAEKPSKDVNTTANRQVSVPGGSSNANARQGITPPVVETKPVVNTQPMIGQHMETIRQSQAAAQRVSDQKRRDNLTSTLLPNSSNMSVMDLYSGASGKTGTSGYHWNENLAALYGQVTSMWDNEVEPAWNTYQQAMTDYNAGRLDLASATKAYNDYVSIQSRYDPLQRAFESVMHSNGGLMPDDIDYQAAGELINYWDASMNAAEKNLNRMSGELLQMQDDYEKAVRQYNLFKSDKQLEKVNELAQSINRMTGEYNAALFVLSEMGGEYGNLLDGYQAAETRYYEANPQALRRDDTVESINLRLADAEAEYNRLQEEFDGVNGETTDFDSIAALEKQLNEAKSVYQSLNWLSNWASEAGSNGIESRKRWDENGWTWEQVYNLYKNSPDEETAKTYLDELTRGYGLVAATEDETNQLVTDLREQFNTAAEEWEKWSYEADMGIEGYTPKSAKEAEKEFHEIQTRLHDLGQKATNLQDVMTSVSMMVATDYGSIIRLLSEPLQKGLEAAGLPITAQFLADANSIMKADRAKALDAMQRSTFGMNKAAQMGVNLLPSFLECLMTMSVANWMAGLSGVAKLPNVVYAEGMAGSIAHAQSVASTTSAMQSVLSTTQYAMHSLATNPMFWSSFARVAGTDFTDTLDRLAKEHGGEYTNKDMMTALTYAMVDGSLNAIIEVGGISEFGGYQNLPFREADKVFSTKWEAFTDGLKTAFLSNVEEGWEEVNQGIMERALRAYILNGKLPDEDYALLGIGATDDITGERERAIFSLFEGLEEYLGGFIVSVGAGGANVATSISSNMNTVDQLQRVNAILSDQRNIQKLNMANMVLPEELRLEPLDPETCTPEQVAMMNLYLSVLMKSEVGHVMKSAEDIYNKAKEANPDVTILDNVATELQDKGLNNAAEAQKQGEIISKILNGEKLTKGEIDDLDLNNKVVRSVFIDRTGLVGMPSSTDISSAAKATYVGAASAMVQNIRANQKAIGESAVQLAEAQQKRAGEQLDKTLDRSKNPLKRRKENISARSNKAGSTFDSRVEYLHRNDPVAALESGDAESIVSEVRQRASVPDLMTRSEFAESPEYQEQTGEGLDNAYIMYLTDAGLSPAEISAMIAASDISERSATNDLGGNETTGPELRRGTGGRELVNDEPGRAVPVREEEEGSRAEKGQGTRAEKGQRRVKVGEWGSPEAVGIPGGASDGSQVRELTGEEIKNNPGFVNIVETAKMYGLSPDHVHFVQTMNGTIEIDTPDGAIGIRGMHVGLTQEIWVVTNNGNYSAKQIFGHELMHHICEICPELVEQVRQLVTDEGLWPDIKRHITSRSIKEYRSKGEAGIFIEMLCDANGKMHRSYLQGDFDLAKQLRMATALYLCTAPDDMIAASPEVREYMQLRSQRLLDSTKQNPNYGIHYSAIDITSDRKDSHHDNLGRQLSKLMDKYMANSYMRVGLKKFMPLMTMYRGAGMRREIMGSTEDNVGPLVFWTDRPDIARTYSQGKGKSDLTHFQEHTKERQRIKELGMEYSRIKRTNYSNMSDEEKEEAQLRDLKRLREIDKELEKLRAEVEPFSKDIYAPSKDHNVWPEKPNTFEEAKALIKRFGAYNRKADIRTLDGNKLVADKAVPLIEEAKKRLTRMIKFFEDYTKAQDQADAEPDPEDILGAPPWANEDTPEGLPGWANLGIPGFFKENHDPAKKAQQQRNDDQIRAEILDEAKGILDTVENLQDTDDLSALYDALDSLCGITDSLVSEFLIGYDEKNDAAADIRSAYYKDTSKSSFRWSDVETMAAAVYNQVYSNSDTCYELYVKGLGTKKVFTSEQGVIDFARDLVNQLGEKGIYSCYLNITKPLIIDCKGLDWAILNVLNNNIVRQVAAWKIGAESVADMTEGELASTDVGTDDIGAWASLQVDNNGNQKYDGVILTNIVDTHGIDNTFNFIGSGKSTVAITWDANTVKSTANATPTSDPRISYSEEDIERSNTYGEEFRAPVSGTAEERNDSLYDDGSDRGRLGQDRPGEYESGVEVSGADEEVSEEEGQLPWEVIDEDEEDYEAPSVTDKWKDLDDLSREVLNNSGYVFNTTVDGNTLGSSKYLGITNGADNDILWRVPLSVATKYLPATVTDLLERAKEAGFDVFSKINFVWSYSEDGRMHIVRNDGSISSCVGCFDKATGEIFVVLNNSIPKFSSYNLVVQQTFIHELFHRMAYDLEGFVDNLLWNLNRRYDKEAETFKKLFERAKTQLRDTVPSYSRLSQSELSEEVLAEIYAGSAALIWSGEESLTSLYSTIEKFRQYIEDFADRNYGTHYSEEDEDKLAMYDMFPIDISAYDGYTTDSVSPVQRERALKFLYAQADKYAKLNGKDFDFAKYIKSSNLREIKQRVQSLGAGSSYVNTVYSELKSYIDKQAAKAARAEVRAEKQKQKEYDNSPEGRAEKERKEAEAKDQAKTEAERKAGIRDSIKKAAVEAKTPGQRAIIKVLSDLVIKAMGTKENIEGNYLNMPGIVSSIGENEAQEIHAIGETPKWLVDFIGLLDTQLGIDARHLLSAATKYGVNIYGASREAKAAHGVGIDLVSQLPDLINNAIAVFDDRVAADNVYTRDAGDGVRILTRATRGSEPVIIVITPSTNDSAHVRETGESNTERRVHLYDVNEKGNLIHTTDTIPVNQVSTVYSVANLDGYISKLAEDNGTALWADMQGIEELYNKLGKEVPDFFKNAPHEKENATRFKGAENANRLNLSEEDINALVKDIEEKLGPDEAKRVKQEFRKLQSELKTKEHEIEVVRERNKATKLVKQTENRTAQKEIKSLTKERDNAVNERDKARESKIKALEKANIDTTWKVKMAESKGEQDLIEATRLWRDKFNYANKTNKQWTNGLVDSTRKNTRREERKLAKEQRKLDRKVSSLPAKAAVRNRSKFNNRANDVVINDGQSLATPIGFEEERTILQKAADFGKWVKDTGSKAYRIITNAVQELDMFAKLQSRMDNVARWVNMVRGAKSTIQQFYEVGMVDKQGNIIGPALNKLLICYDENGNVDEAMQKALEQYMFYKHTVDRMSIKSRADQKVRDFEAQNAWVTTLDDDEFAREVADGNEKAVEYAKLLLAANEAKDKPVLADADGNPVTAESAQEVVDMFEREMPALVQKAQDIYDWWGVFMLEWAVGTSITEEDFFAMREMYPHYVPTYRVMKHGKHAGGMNAGPDSLTPGVVTKEATGSLRDLEALPDQFVNSMHKIVKMNRQNSLLQNIIEELMFDDDGVFKEYGYFDWDGASEALKQDLWDFAEETDDTCVEKVKIDGKDVYRISCWVNGEKMSAYVNRAMFEGLNFLFDKHSKAYTTAIKIGNFLTKPMKMAITGLNLTFAIKNPIRDVQTALVNSIAGPAFGKYLALAGAKMATSDDDWIVFQNLGGVSSEMHYNERGFVKNITKKDSAWEKAKNVLGTPGEISEAVTRFAEYLATLDMLGGDTFENRVAGIKNAAEVTVDFGRKGMAGGIINSFVPYWNPGLQGMDKALRSVLEKEGLWGKLKQLGRAGVINVLPKALAMLLTMLAGRWEDWEKLSDQVKDNYICIPIPGDDHKFLKLPISQDWGAYLGGTFTRIVEGVAGRDDPFENFYESALSSTLPFDWLDIGGIKVPFITPIGLDWLMELKENKNYNGSAIVPYDLEDVSPTEQWTSDTTELAYLIAKALHASPIAIDYIIGDYFGNFWGLVPKLVPHGYFTGESTFNDKLQETINSLSTPWIADNRYSSAATASYYDLLDALKQEVTDAEAHGGNKEDAEHYEFYKALTTNGGFVDQIRELTAQARELPPGDDKDRIRDTIAGLADEALDFYKAWENGEIKDPVHWATYHRYGDKIMEATAALSKYAEDFNFSGALGNPTIIYDRSGEKDVKYRLDDDQQKAYAVLRQNNYRDVLNQTINSSQYREADAKGRAALLEAAKTEALKLADKDMLDWLKRNHVTGETITKVDWSYEEKQAAYSISQILGMDNAYDERITDTLIRLYDYTDRYNFTPVESTRKTFISQTDDTQVYELDKTQQAKYSEMYHDIYTDYATKVINSAEFKAASDEEQAVMLQRMRTYVTDKVAEDYNAWLERTGAQSVTRDKASEVMSLEAKYAVQRAIGYDENYPATITNELIRLYDNKSVGSQSYLPPEYRPTSYTVYDKRGKNTGYKWILNSEQKDMYEAIAQDIYRVDMLRVINSSQYASLDDYGKAQLLCATRDQVTEKAKEQFIAWLIQTNAPMTNMNTAAEQERKADIKAAERIVEVILG